MVNLAVVKDKKPDCCYKLLKQWAKSRKMKSQCVLVAVKLIKLINTMNSKLYYDVWSCSFSDLSENSGVHCKEKNVRDNTEN